MAKGEYQWIRAGEEWSECWGGSAAQWFGAILPRIHEALPASAILEIGPGFGRWTKYLKSQCDQLVIVDPDKDCIEACRTRFASDSHITTHMNDGRSLAMVADGSIDFAFSFDSLVHVKREVIEAYLTQLATKLKPGGVGFFHHSNLAEYADHWPSRVTGQAGRFLRKICRTGSDHQRAPDMKADLFRFLCAEFGLQCVRQELVNWRGPRLIDCFSTFARRGPKPPEEFQFFRNTNFMREAESIRRLSRLNPALNS